MSSVPEFCASFLLQLLKCAMSTYQVTRAHSQKAHPNTFGTDTLNTLGNMVHTFGTQTQFSTKTRFHTFICKDTKCIPVNTGLGACLHAQTRTLNDGVTP